MPPSARVIVLMGVSGSGKTTVGRLLAQELGWTFFDGDDYHPPANIQKMSQGIPLRDEDRYPWLEALQSLIHGLLEQGEPAVLAASALKQEYRERLLAGNLGASFVYLKGEYRLISQRLQNRQVHFMDSQLLESQFEALEEPQDVMVVEVTAEPAEIVANIRRALRL
ncbi:MAG: gluconokinase [Dehalococcoidia bacterium]